MMEKNRIQENQVAGTAVIWKMSGRGRAKVPSFKVVRKNSFLPLLCNHAQRNL